MRTEAAAAGLPPPIGVSHLLARTTRPVVGHRAHQPEPRRLDATSRSGRASRPPSACRPSSSATRTWPSWASGATARRSGASNAIYVTVSTGIGGGIIIDGRPLVGTDGTAGEVGHLVVEIDGPTCGCGGVGHVEAIASGTAIARDGRALLERRGDAAAPLAELAAGGAEVDAELVARAAAAGDAECVAILERAWVAIGAMCASLVNLLDPEVIVIGGSIAEHHPRLFDVAREELARRAFPILLDRVRIVPAALGGDVSLIGGLPIVNDRIDDPAYAAGSRPKQGALHS